MNDEVSLLGMDYDLFGWPGSAGCGCGWGTIFDLVKWPGPWAMLSWRVLLKPARHFSFSWFTPKVIHFSWSALHQVPGIGLSISSPLRQNVPSSACRARPWDSKVIEDFGQSVDLPPHSPSPSATVRIRNLVF